MDKQQVRRHLLDTVGTPMHVTNPHISFIRLEGVDSSGNVCEHHRGGRGEGMQDHRIQPYKIPTLEQEL